MTTTRVAPHQVRAEHTRHLAPLQPPFYACALPIAPAVALSSTTASREHIARHRLRRAWVPLVEGQLDETVAWSREASAQIAEGEGE
jgi:hypothetical protein